MFGFLFSVCGILGFRFFFEGPIEVSSLGLVFIGAWSQMEVVKVVVSVDGVSRVCQGIGGMMLAV